MLIKNTIKNLFKIIKHVILLIFILHIACYAADGHLDDNRLQFELSSGWEMVEEDGETPWGRFNTEPGGSWDLPANQKILRAIFPGHIVVSADVYVLGTVHGLTVTPGEGNKAKEVQVMNSIVTDDDAEFGGFFIGKIPKDTNSVGIAHKSAKSQTTYALIQSFAHGSDSRLASTYTQVNAATNGRVSFRVDNQEKVVVTKIGVGIGLEGSLPNSALRIEGHVMLGDYIYLHEAASSFIRKNGSSTVDLASNADFLLGDKDDSVPMIDFKQNLKHFAYNKVGFSEYDVKGDLFRNENPLYTNETQIQIDGSLSIGLADNNLSPHFPVRIYFCGQYDNTDIMWMGRTASNKLTTVLGDDTGINQREPAVSQFPGEIHHCSAATGSKDNGPVYPELCHHPSHAGTSDSDPAYYPQADPDLGYYGPTVADAPTGYDAEPDHNYWYAYSFYVNKVHTGTKYSSNAARLATDQNFWTSSNKDYLDTSAVWIDWRDRRQEYNYYRDSLVVGYVGPDTDPTREPYEPGPWQAAVRILSDGGSMLYQSDFRLKKNIQPVSNALDNIRELRGVAFHWKTDKEKPKNKTMGLIAQEVEKILPRLVDSDTPESIKLLNYEGLLPVIIEAIKEQQPQIEDIKYKIIKIRNGLKAIKQL
jgi:hypothetical protein